MIRRIRINEDNDRDIIANYLGSDVNDVINGIDNLYNIISNIFTSANSIENYCSELRDNLKTAYNYTVYNKDASMADDIEFLKSELNAYAKKLKNIEAGINHIIKFDI